MTSGAAVLSARAVEKSYREGGLAVDVLRGADLDVAPGEVIAVVGASGSVSKTISRRGVSVRLQSVLADRLQDAPRPAG